jgi:predicted nuclease with TOPRIM domain
MADDTSNKGQRIGDVQEELNRQALVSLGKRISELEERISELQEQIDDLKYFSGSALETAKRLQGIVKDLSLRLKFLKQKVNSDQVNVDIGDDEP